MCMGYSDSKKSRLQAWESYQLAVCHMWHKGGLNKLLSGSHGQLATAVASKGINVTCVRQEGLLNGLRTHVLTEAPRAVSRDSRQLQKSVLCAAT